MLCLSFVLMRCQPLRRALAFTEECLTIVSISQDVPLANYNLMLFLTSVFSAVFFIFLIFHPKYSVKESALYTSLFFAVFYYSAYLEVDKFYELTLNNSYIELKYAPPSQSKLIGNNDVESVTFGTYGKAGSRCYVAINLLSGDKYKSAAISDKIEVCKNVRNELQKHLALKS
ncbi:hypothetical protein EFU42_17750 [Vibrio cholerae]|nr:hypothetical protein [Vibrio cholerae]EGR2472397.1 hypothetical protein [Vibrio cholerae]EGR2513172.1 hypothetical protein [Vibrio cholerae]EGR4071182.1 hypothetical protein [Vibrio cholerae]EGR4129925.1 hypothetical protein [Vibrio cholerae]